MIGAEGGACLQRPTCVQHYSDCSCRSWGSASESGRSADGGIPDWHSEDSFVRVRVDGFLSASARSAEGDE